MIDHIWLNSAIIVIVCIHKCKNRNLTCSLHEHWSRIT